MSSNNIQFTTLDQCSNGGKNRAKKLSPEQRKEIARKGGLAKGGHRNLPVASHVGEIKLGDAKIACAVVDGKRYISKTALQKAFGRKDSGRIPNSVKEIIENKGGAPAASHNIPGFLRSENLLSLIHSDLISKMGAPLSFLWKGTNSLTYGYEADILPDLCSLFIEAKDLGILTKNQEIIAHQSKIIAKGLMKVGIIALVDEVTGYQEFRDRDELTKILDKYIAKELQPWTKKFHPEFFKEIYKLHNWQWGVWANHPQCVGKFINKFIYDQMPPGVMDELRNKNPSDEEGKRDHLHHQFLTPIGNEHLGKHLAIITTLMRLSRNKGEFKLMFEKAFAGEQLMLDI